MKSGINVYRLIIFDKIIEGEENRLILAKLLGERKEGTISHQRIADCIDYIDLRLKEMKNGPLITV